MQIQWETAFQISPSEPEPQPTQKKNLERIPELKHSTAGFLKRHETRMVQAAQMSHTILLKRLPKNNTASKEYTHTHFYTVKRLKSDGFSSHVGGALLTLIWLIWLIWGRKWLWMANVWNRTNRATSRPMFHHTVLSTSMPELASSYSCNSLVANKTC